uniref:HDAC_interact domain-containing protein n=1 Tax=Schistosoma mansoni TaxID=6183 RepID=A0A5K4F1Y2_SCHMA
MMKCLKVEDALSYLDQVKARFSGQGAIYMDFLDVMRDFKAQTIGTEVVIRRVRELFEGHPDLITGFNTFIPQGYRMDTLTSHQSLNAKPTCTVIPSRTTLSISSADNVTPVKGICALLKITEAPSEWTPPGSLTSLVSSHHEPASRPNSYVPVVSNSLPLTSASPVHVLTPNIQPDNPSLNSSSQQQLLPTDCQENLPNVMLRSSHNTSNLTHSPHVYQQHQQIQSFHHALQYVNKIKNRFQGIPDVYKRFLDILQWYQKEQRHSDPMCRKQAELQVYQDVAKLFGGQEDLLQEFSQFLPESFGVTSAVTETIINRKNSSYSQLSGSDVLDPSVPVPHLINRVSEGISLALSSCKQRPGQEGSPANPDTKKLKRLAPAQSIFPNVVPSLNPPKKSRSSVRDVSVVDANQLTTGIGISLLQKIRDALDADSPVGNRSYQTFLQNVCLFNRRIIAADELLEATHPLFLRHVEVWKRFSDFVMSSRNSSQEGFGHLQPHTHGFGRDKHDRDKHNICSFLCDPHACSDALPNNMNNQPPASLISLVSEVSQKRLDLDFTKLRTCGVSYRALPSNFPQSKCSGRQKCPVAKEVLNDSYISFSSLTSEDSQFVSSKKNQYEENMYRVEDERYEVDMVTELNRAAMQNLVVVKRCMDRMSKEELNQFHLDDKLGGTSAVLMKKAIHRVYGDKAGDVIYGLKNCPNTVLPLVIQRMRQKDSEWRETIRNYQRSWADQDARNYLRSLDHQGATFKQRDAPFIRSKTMISQIETIARNDKIPPCHSTSDPVGKMISTLITQRNLISRDISNPGTMGSALANVLEGNNEDESAHLTLVYPPPDVRNTLLEDAASLIIHHVKRQSNASKNDKRSMKCLIRTVLQDIFMANRFPMSDDEDDEDEDEDMNQKEDEDEPTADDLIENEEHCRIRSVRQPKSTKRFLESRKSVPTEQTIYNHTEFDQLRKDDMKIQTEALGSQTNGLSSKSKSDDLIFPELSMQSNSMPCHINQDNSENELRNMELSYIASLPKNECYSVLYGNNHWYSFLRLHHLLLCRLHHLRSYCAVAAQQFTLERDEYHVQAAEVLRLRRHGGTEPSQYYSRALNLVKDLLDGGEDINTFEDRLRDMFSIYAYPWFTMDRLIINIVRQLQALASGDELSRRLTALHRSWIGNSSYSDRNSQSTGVASNFPQYSNVCGPLYTRVCRLANESAYYSQAMSICSAFAGANGSCNVGSSSGIFPSSTSQNNTNVTSNSNTTSWPNCFLIVVLSESSTMLIRLMKPVHSTKLEGEKSYDSCFPYSSHATLNPHSLLVSSEDPGIVDREVHLHRENLKSNLSIRHWYDYLTTYLSWTIGYVPHSICSRIRPVFLYRNVRRCVNALTRDALQRRQQLLVDTGDIQPEEILSQGLVSSGVKNPISANKSETDEQFKSPNASNFERDVWEFMIRVFKNNLTHKELFRDTFSSDCMHFTERLDSRVTRNHKINWSVGSYGIFIRYRRRTSRNYSPTKWHKFHSDWLAKHPNCVHSQNKDETQNVKPEINLETEEVRSSAASSGVETIILEKPIHEKLDIDINDNHFFGDVQST